MSAYDGRRRPRPGRPRHIDKAVNPERSAREEVLDAAARLFADQGYANTSTREIADAVGMRQASLYYHFPDKADMLAEVLAQTIRPTLEKVGVVEDLTDDPATALYLLALLDARTLVAAPHNSGLLGLLPDVATEIPEFGVARLELGMAYGRLGALVASRKVTNELGTKMGSHLLTMVETVITWRGDGSYRSDSGDAIAGSCLRICGVGEDVIDEARAAAHALLPEVDSDATTKPD